MSSKRPRVFITRALPDEIMASIQNVCDCTWNDQDSPVTRERLLQEAARVDGILSMVTDQLDREFFAAAPNLRVIANMAVGYDNIDVRSAKEHGVIVCNTPDVLTESTADLTFALLLSTARRLVEAANFLLADKWQSWGPMLLAGQDVYGKVLGIVGLGRIGMAVARRAQGFGMKILYYNRHRKVPEEEQRLGIEYRDLESLLRESDFVSVLTPLTEETTHLISSRELAMMKKTAILVNTSRGPVVDEAALYQALVNQQIGGAGLDVYSHEPVRADNPLVCLQNVVALPHIGSATLETRWQMARLAADNLILVLTGKDPKTRVV